MAFPLKKSEMGREKHVSVPAESSHFFPFKKVLYWRCQNVTFFGKDVIKNVTSQKKKFRVRPVPLETAQEAVTIASKRVHG